MALYFTYEVYGNLAVTLLCGIKSRLILTMLLHEEKNRSGRKVRLSTDLFGFCAGGFFITIRTLGEDYVF